MAVPAFGMRPVQHTSGATWNGVTRDFLIPSTDGSAVFVGDMVMATGGVGAAGVTVAGQDCEGIMKAIITTGTTAGAANFGPAVGFSVDPTNLSKKHRAASENRLAHVSCDPLTVYEMNEDGDTTPVTTTTGSLNAAIVLTAGSATTGISAQVFDSSTVATTAAFPLKLLGLSKKIGNAYATTVASQTVATTHLVLMNSGYFIPLQQVAV